MDSGTVISAIQQIFTENQIKTKDVVVAVSGHSVIVKKIRVAKMKPKELEEAIPFEAERMSRTPSRTSTWTFKSWRAPIPTPTNWTSCWSR